MNTQIDQMPAEVATTLLLSGQSMTRRFRKICQMARQRIVEPVSCSTALNVSAPKTGQQRLQARLSKANVKQLLTWQTRTLRRGNRLQDARDNAFFELWSDEVEKEKALSMLSQQIAMHDALCEAINAELTMRSARGIGYRKPIKRSKV